MSTDPLRQLIPTPAQIEALAAGFQRVGRLAQEAANNMVEAFAAAARQMERERWELAEARREAQWHRQQEKAILRQQLDRDPSYFGRKRRWRRARGRRIEARLGQDRTLTVELLPISPCDQIRFTCHVVPREEADG
jgi:hypothetical protein